MMKKIIFLVMVFLLIANVHALTASIGNSRMIVNAKPGEEVEKYILVKNVNDIPVTIDLTVSGDLKDNLILRESSFELAARDEKKAYFVVKSYDVGTTETKINVRYTPEEGNGVGLSSTLILVVGGDSIDNKENPKPADENNNTGFNFNPSGNNIPRKEGFSFPKISGAVLLVISTFVLVIILVVLLLFLMKRKNHSKKGAGRPNA